MKKVKLMLLSLNILAIAGGALAFEVNTGQHVCFAQVTQGTNCAQVICPELVKLIVTYDIDMWVCTAPVPVGGCHDDLQCVGNPVNSTIE